MPYLYHIFYFGDALLDHLYLDFKVLVLVWLFTIGDQLTFEH